MSHQNAYAAIAAERRRQRTELGYSDEHDRAHGTELLIRAGTAYLRADVTGWPFERDGFKPRTHVRNLVRAGALFLAAADAAPADHQECCRERAMRLADSTMKALAAEITAVQMLTSVSVAAPRRLCDPPEPRTLKEGDDAKLAVKIYRMNSEQAFIEFTSMEGTVGGNPAPAPYSIRVPLSELS